MALPKSAIQDLLKVLAFEKVGSESWEKVFTFPSSPEYRISVDLGKGSIEYPPPVQLGDLTTSNLKQDENLVVLECVVRLLEKGYLPSTLVLEKRYQVGRGASGGKSDITILRRTKDPLDQKDAPPLMIIECKTWGNEHDKEKERTVEEGGQLFGYLQQDLRVSHLCIYSSTLSEDKSKVIYRSDIINIIDTERAEENFSNKEKEVSLQAAHDDFPLYKYAHNRQALHYAWTKTYSAKFQDHGVFELEFTPYSIGYIPLRKKDLREFSPENGSSQVFNHFMEILRHNNVSDRENAFNRLCAIILAKLVDEEKTDEEVLDFQWFPSKDTDEDLIDRLQRLYKLGMKDSLGEDITYFTETDIDDAFRAHKKDMARSEVKRIFRALKFFTNNDFAFIEVHNEKLFRQNSKVVREIVELFEGFRLKYTSKQSFLGNLFESLLNSGFKQAEGQFFTPIPIARFMVRSLPIRELIQGRKASGSDSHVPTIMDYACGSAHFLTEAIDEVQEDLESLSLTEAKDTRWTGDHVFGVEKDYRLARTAKISLYLHGAGDSKVFHSDGLEHASSSLPRSGSLDILIANPPYSVKDFKQHLSLETNKFELFKYLTKNSSEIEVLFLERASQLLRDGGWAALILPASILSNPGVYRKAREQLFGNFLIRSVVELGGSAFGETGTKTIILFLEKRPSTDKEHIENRTEELFFGSGEPNDEDFSDTELLEAYCSAAELEVDSYCSWLRAEDKKVPEILQSTVLFQGYISNFERSKVLKTLVESPGYLDAEDPEREEMLSHKFDSYCRAYESKKFLFHCLTYVECFQDGHIAPQATVVMRASGTKTEEKKFLGYGWSKRRGREGFVPNSSPYDGGFMYTPNLQDRNEAPYKLSNFIRAAFDGGRISEVPKAGFLADRLEVSNFADYLDFSRANLDLVISTKPQKSLRSIEFDTIYDLVPFEKLATLEYGKALPERNRNPGPYWVMGSNGEIGRHDSYLVEGPAVIVGRKGSAGKVTYVTENCYPIDTTFFVAHDIAETELRYIEVLLKELKLEDQARALGVPGLNRNDVYKFRVPKPSRSAQEKFVQALDGLEKKSKKIVIDSIEDEIHILFRALLKGEFE